MYRGGGTLVRLWAPIGGFGPLAASFGNLRWRKALDQKLDMHPSYFNHRPPVHHGSEIMRAL